MAKIFNRVRVATATNGQGTLTLGAADANAYTPAESGVQDGDPVGYLIEEGNDFEIGPGVYSSTGPALTRPGPVTSKIGGTAGTTKLTLTGTAKVSIIFRANDILEKLTADRTYHIRTDGSDANSGLVDSAGGAWLTLGHAWEHLASNVNIAGYNVYLQHGNGTYDLPFISFLPLTGGGNVHIKGNAADSSLVIFDTSTEWALFEFDYPQLTSIQIQDATVKNTAGGGVLFGMYGCQINVTNCILKPQGYSIVHASGRSGGISFHGANTITPDGTVGSLFEVDSGAKIGLQGSSVVNITSSVTLTTACARSFSGGSIIDNGSWTGSGATGSRFDINSGAIINCATTLPGNAAGTNTGGWYNSVFGTTTIDLGNLSDTTFTRVSPGVAAIEGLSILTTATGTIKGYIWGLTMSNAADTVNDITVAAGEATDEGGAGVIVLAAAITKRLDATWAVGTDQGGLNTGAEANSTWYEVHLIKRVDTGIVDVMFTTTANRATLPANYTQQRRVGWIRNDGSGNILQFTQIDDHVTWTTPVNDVSATSTATAAAVTLTAPPSSIARFRGTNQCTTATNTTFHTVFSEIVEGNVTPAGTTGIASLGGADLALTDTGHFELRVSSTSTIEHDSDGTTTTFDISTFGYIDRRRRMSAT